MFRGVRIEKCGTAIYLLHSLRGSAVEDVFSR